MNLTPEQIKLIEDKALADYPANIIKMHGHTCDLSTPEREICIANMLSLLSDKDLMGKLFPQLLNEKI